MADESELELSELVSAIGVMREAQVSDPKMRSESNPLFEGGSARQIRVRSQ